MVCRIRPVQYPHQFIPYGGTRDIRPGIRGWQYQKTDQAKGFGKKIRADKTEGLFTVLPASKRIVYDPKQVTAQIDGNCPWDKGNLVI